MKKCIGCEKPIRWWQRREKIEVEHYSKEHSYYVHHHKKCPKLCRFCGEPIEFWQRKIKKSELRILFTPAHFANIYYHKKDCYENAKQRGGMSV